MIAIADKIQSMADSMRGHYREPEWPDPSEIEGISEHQRAELSKAITRADGSPSNIALLSGGPGCGKTHTIARLIKTMLQQNRGMTVRMMAPTGKAAQRMTEMAREVKLPIAGTTIHTGLVPQRNGHDGAGWGFFHGENQPIYANLIVLDESPMVPSDLMRHFLAAVSPGTKVIFSGDPDQLAPVGKGRPYADMIESGLPHGHLTEIHRFAGRIARVCRQINQGEIWTPSPRIDLDAPDFPENMRHVECVPQNIINSLNDLLQRVQKRGFNLASDVQILVATNDQRERLNGVLQESLNPKGDRVDGNPFRIGDKAICLRNQWVESDWQGKWKPKDLPQHYVANGEIGIVTRVDKSFTVIEFNEKKLRFNKAGWKDISLAYAVTVWKAQGSQWPVVITVAEDTRGADSICDRSFWYTGISRGGKLSLTLGRRAAIDRQCSRAGLYHRKTLLKEKIQGWLSPEEHSETQAPIAGDDFSDV